eukprot:CAMPEP_0196578292 /NCGR_PEP_ID=MMETSP1081-20130531/7211_1 /TAXON_ID=36882 /ORGANISM="Pyramimonas amylifera, Strain CCMP720" /LENGTH=548 /DNA_ID=CAMNT_0041897459 /DNA_START=389 /DNA_END=2035 /DNA_ORIENTATION=+
MNMVTALHRLARHSKREIRPPQELTCHPGFEKLRLKLEAAKDKLSPRLLANMLWAYATLQLTLEPALLYTFDVLFSKKMDGMKPQELVNTMWAYATLRHKPCAILQNQVRRRVLSFPPGSLKPQEIANLLWAFATLSINPGEAALFHLESDATHHKLVDFKPLELSMTLWSLATLKRFPGAEWMDHVTNEIGMQAYKMTPQSVSNSIWACASMKYNPSFKVLNQTAQQMKRTAHQATPQALANTVRGWAVLNYYPKDESIWCEIEKKVCEQMKSSNEQNISNLIWAFAFLGREPSTELLHHLHEGIMDNIESFSLNGLVYSLWGHASLGIRPREDCLEALTESVGRVAESLNEVHLVNVLWAWVLLKYKPDEKVMEKIRERLQMFCESESPLPGVQEQLFQIHLAHVLLELDMELEIPEDILETARSSWINQTQRNVTPSEFVDNVSKILMQMEVAHSVEVLTPSRYFSLDILLDGQKLVLECDGPTHFTRNSFRYLGSTTLRDEFLAAEGFSVVSIPYFDWQNLGSCVDTKIGYLKGRILEASKNLK